MTLNADKIFPFLYQGGTPPTGWALRELGFSAVVLCAVEEQIPAERFCGIDVIHAPNDDNMLVPPSPEQLRTAIQAARRAAEYVRGEKKVLVACHAGLNRSGFVNALTIHFLTGEGGEYCVRRIQARRRGALFNRLFVSILRRLSPRIPDLASAS